MEAQVTLGEHLLPYQWKQSPRRRTVAVTVHPENGVVVHTPSRYSRRRVEAFLREKAAWILKHRARFEQERARRRALRWELGALLPFLGARYPLHFVLDGGREQVRLEQGRFVLGLPLDGDGAAFGGRVRERMLDWYREQATALILERVGHFKGLLGVTPLRVRVKQQKRRWGSCSAKGALNFNWQLVLAPPDVLDYVVVHELCHLIVLNHSPRFWALVEGVLPDYRERRLWLRENGHRLAL
ncbi:MAG: SprT family zinc-dependent metalloprotease [SAR324 cluster bacterium]|nr:SprT family zinc-dependent metalloprotease [SAR324 cluster bacterium]